MKTSIAIVAACAAVSEAMPSYRFGNWNSTVVNWNISTPTNWNSTTVINCNSTIIANETITVNATAGNSPLAASPYYINITAVSINTTCVNNNETRFSPNQTHLPVHVIRRFRPQRKTSSGVVLLGYN